MLGALLAFDCLAQCPPGGSAGGLPPTIEARLQALEITPDLRNSLRVVLEAQHEERVVASTALRRRQQAELAELVDAATLDALLAASGPSIGMHPRRALHNGRRE